jgi:hypothetical protein
MVIERLSGLGLPARMRSINISACERFARLPPCTLADDFASPMRAADRAGRGA